ncbi:Serine/threonine-protein kinase RIO1 [Candidatus Nitrosotalea sp. TS]|uniref:serine protein kinase RIO n=1 Tax=Candidatus Nitrosotalea sp. TS TaxID=2341020 RepID=UPI0014094D34|nr:RIO1 family regulatory kinase/ATPase [Candidatus Nitrosotalea sp. TS]NHI03752.1 Serine/threonine-protein kinase RIO1 [Candidatus Nitrosotalea sp. TS]
MSESTLLPDDLGKKLAKRVDNHLLKNERRGTSEKDIFDKKKVMDDVLDRTSIMTLSKLINSGTIAYVNGVVGSGKEAKMYWAVDRDGKDVALKIYLVTASNFKKRKPYLVDDPRFTRIKKGTRNMVELWAQKEFRNLTQCVKHDIPSIKPIRILKNVLVLEFVGKNGTPAKTLVESEIDENDYKNAISIISQLYKKAELVHADFSEYNIFKTESGLILFDLGSAIDIRHRNAKEFLQRDITNISRFFVKRGLTVEHPSDVMARITN